MANKHLLIQTPRNKLYQRIFDLFKLINKETTVIHTILALLLSFSAWYYVRISVLLLFIPYAEWCNQMPRFKAQHCTFSNSWVHNFLGILRKSQINYFSKTSLDVYFKLTSDISLHSRAGKSGGHAMGQNTGKSYCFVLFK